MSTECECRGSVGPLFFVLRFLPEAYGFPWVLSGSSPLWLGLPQKITSSNSFNVGITIQ